MTDLAKHIALLDTHLARFRKDGIVNLIGGKDVAGSGGSFETRSPVDDSLIATVSRSTAADVDAAARAAKAAFPAWAAMEGKERKKILHRIADQISWRAGRIAGDKFNRFFLDPRHHEIRHFIDNAHQVEGNRVQLHLPGFDF